MTSPGETVGWKHECARLKAGQGWKGLSEEERKRLKTREESETLAFSVIIS